MIFHKDPLLRISNQEHSPHVIVPPLILKNSTILDVGCNTGYLAKVLKARHITTDGIDINVDALKIAKKHCRHVYQRNLYSPQFNIPSCKYDYIIFLDILEHLPRPDLILIDARHYLKPGGTIIVSLPNIARFEIRFNLLFGNFTYTHSGSLSTDHLRFFTKGSAIKMFDECGYRVEKTYPTGLGHMVKIFPNWTAFQFIYIATLKKEN